MTLPAKLTILATYVTHDLRNNLRFIQQSDSHGTGNNMVTIGELHIPPNFRPNGIFNLGLGLLVDVDDTQNTGRRPKPVCLLQCL